MSVDAIEFFATWGESHAKAQARQANGVDRVGGYYFCFWRFAEIMGGFETIIV
jgi:hypothetical protein